MIRLGEAQAVEKRHGPRTHRDDVAQDPSDARRGALERLDGGRVVVALDLERDREAVSEVEHAGVLAGSLEHARAGRREPLQEERRVLVAAVLGPEQREHRELEVVRIAREQRADSLVLPVGEAECAMERRIRHAAQDVSLSRRSDLARGTRLAWVASARCALLAADPAARGHVGRVVPLHQGRRRGHPAGRHDRVPCPRSPACCSRATSCGAWGRRGRSRSSAPPGGRASCSASSTARCRWGSWPGVRRTSTRAWPASRSRRCRSSVSSSRLASCPHERVGAAARRRRRARLPRRRGAHRARHRRAAGG